MPPSVAHANAAQSSGPRATCSRKKRYLLKIDIARKSSVSGRPPVACRCSSRAAGVTTSAQRRDTRYEKSRSSPSA